MHFTVSTGEAGLRILHRRSPFLAGVLFGFCLFYTPGILDPFSVLLAYKVLFLCLGLEVSSSILDLRKLGVCVLLQTSSVAGLENGLPFFFRDLLRKSFQPLGVILTTTAQCNATSTAPPLPWLWLLRRPLGWLWPWLHLDIAGPAFAETEVPESRLGGTGAGVMTLMRWLESV